MEYVLGGRKQLMIMCSDMSHDIQLYGYELWKDFKRARQWGKNPGAELNLGS